jgi:cytochrome c oxidase subunit III
MTKNYNQNIAEEAEETLSMEPKKFILWLFIVSSVMFFASQTSAYLVKRAEGNWAEFEVPQIFWYGTAVIILSSITMQFAVYSAKKDNFNALKTAISITFALAILFLVLQVEGWKELVKQNVYFVGNASGSFFYAFTVFHGVHILMGLIVLGVTFVSSLRMKVHATALRRIEICATFWHFLGLVWVYLFAFLLYFR